MGTDSQNEDLKALRLIFKDEAAEKLSVLEDRLLALETNPTDREAVAEAFRAAHTVKGGAAMVELKEVATFTHSLEAVLEDLRAGRKEPTPALVGQLLAGLDVVRRLVDEADSPSPEALAAAAVVVEGLAAPHPSHALSDAPSPGSAPPQRGTPAPTGGTDRTLRVDVQKLDRLLEAVGQLAVWRRGFKAQLVEAATPNLEQLGLAFEAGDVLLEELRSGVMEMRLVPLGPFLRRLSRPVRDMARAGDKDVALVVEGEEVQVDTAIAERIIEPLTHLVRNAVDHGIETPEVRAAGGKPARATVAVTASREAEGLVIQITDDGAGLSRSRLVERAVAWGVPNAAEMGDAELWELIFHPGFSTAAKVSELSGRGVGMDAVRKAVEGMRGSIEIRSREGAGTTVVLHLPVTLAVIQGLEVAVGHDTYILPMEGVDRCVDLPPGLTPGLTGVLDLEGTPLPLVGLRELFGTLAPLPKEGRSVVLVRQGSLSAGLVVDRLIGDAETVVKPLAANLAGLPGIGGCAVLEDGRVGLVVDVPGLLRWASARTPRATGRTRGAHSLPAERAPETDPVPAPASTHTQHDPSEE